MQYSQIYASLNPLVHNATKWPVTLKTLQRLLQDFLSMSEHFGTLCIKGLRMRLNAHHHKYLH